MASTNSSDFFRCLTRGMAVETLADHSDRQLVERALAGRDEAAFQAIVQRHGPMVYRVCWRALLHPQDAEDAFQATFLVLAQKLRTVRKRPSLASWLHGVARRVALKAKAQAAGRRRHEHEVSLPAAAPPDDVTWKELRSVLDAELGKLPEKWRLPLILCYLEGRTQDEAASQLAWSKSTLRRRLEEARDALGRRLNGRGVVWPAALSAVLLSECIASAAPGLVASTVEVAVSVAAGKTVAAAASVKVAALTEGVLKAMLITKLKTVTAVLLMLGMVTFTCGMLAFGMTSANGDDVEKPAANAVDKAKDAESKKENTLTVTINSQKNRVRAKEPFKVDLRVVNSSKSTQSFRVMNGSWYEHWKSSNDRVSWESWPVWRNSAVTVKLEPGEAYEKTLPMLLVAGKPQEKVSFKMGFTPIGSKQTFWSNEVTVQVDQDKKEPRLVPIASYPSEDRPTEKRIRELLDAAKITFISVGSRGLTASVADDKAKQARAILEKAVVDGSLSVQVLDQLPVAKNLRAVRTDDNLRIEADPASNEEVVVSVAAGLTRACHCEMSVYRGKERVNLSGGTYTSTHEFNREASKIPQPGESYEVELVVKWFETDAPIQPNWKPESGGKYKVLVTRTLKLSVGPENTKLAPVPLDKHPLPRGNAALPELAKKCKGAVVATLQEVGDPEVGPPGAADYASKWKVEKVLRGTYPETAHLSFRVQSVPIESRERPPAVGKTYILITYEVNANQVAAILDADEKNLRKVQDLLAVSLNRWEKLLQDKDLTAKQRAAYEQIAKLHSLKIDDQGDNWGSISVPSFVKDSKLPTDLLYQMGFDALPMLADALDDETPTATVITAREGDFKQVKVWKVNEFVALLIVRIAERDFVIGEFPKELGIRDIAQRPKAAPEFRKLVVAWHGKFAAKTPTERKIADVTDPWFRNRFDAIIWLGWTKTKEGRAPIAARVDAFYADAKRESSSLTRTEMTYCALALGQIGDRASLPQVRRVCEDLSHTVYMAYRPSDQGRWAVGSDMNEDLFRAYLGLALLGEKDEAVKELKRLFAAYGSEMEASTRKDYEKRLTEAKGEAPLKADEANKGAAKDLQFHPGATATDLKIELATAAKVTRPHKAIYLSVKVTNRSSDEIQTGFGHEWGSGKAPARLPGTGLYTTIAPAKEKKAPAFEPAYLAGDASPEIPEQIRLAAGKSVEFLLRMDWPGDGSVPARQFTDEGGSYKVQVLLGFQKKGKGPPKQEYVMSEPTTVEVPGLKPVGPKPEPWTGEPVIDRDTLTGGKKLSTFKRLPKATDATLLRINCYSYKPVADLTAANFPKMLDSMKAVKAGDPKYMSNNLAHWSYAQFETPEGRFQVEFYLGGQALLTAPDGSAGRVTFDLPK